MWKPPRPRHTSDWFSSALAVLALLVFVGGGASWHQLLQEQKAQDEVRTSRLIGCLDAAQLTFDPRPAINACRQKYADRVPALLRTNPYAFVPHRTTTPVTGTLGAMGAPDSPSRPTLSPSVGPEAANRVDVAGGEDASTEPPGGGNQAAAQDAHPPAGPSTRPKRQDATTHDPADPPQSARGERAKGGRPAAVWPEAKEHASPPTAPAPARNGNR